ncbi:hypothetical protein NQ317_014837 [Molorchus minor]|uniref:Uncharacterized protein n=1 Tax=Molorchus minor TaxID=1323400 RepID=A0ABQ9JT50_9CUCU|nr:hypothetical protein NQ317_014837 [Molorchus minor]
MQEEVIQNLLSDRSGFTEQLKDGELSGDWLVLITRILVKICDSGFGDSKLKIFQNVFSHSDYPKQLTSYISNLPNHNEREKKGIIIYGTTPDRFWHDLLVVFEDITKLPSFASQNLPVLLKAIKRTLPAIEEEHGLHISDEIKDKFEVLLVKIKNMKSEYVTKQQDMPNQRERNNDEDEGDPPNDFREISIYPSIIEITSRNIPFLRKNKIRGPYSGIHHYLDVQFRLLRRGFCGTFQTRHLPISRKPHE